jgi:hypothetical protein
LDDDSIVMIHESLPRQFTVYFVSASAKTVDCTNILRNNVLAITINSRISRLNASTESYASSLLNDPALICRSSKTSYMWKAAKPRPISVIMRRLLEFELGERSRRKFKARAAK